MILSYGTIVSLTFMLLVAIDAHAVEDGTLLHVADEDLLQVRPVDHPRVWQGVPLREIPDGVKDRVPLVAHPYGNNTA